METNFFQLIKELHIKGRLQIAIAIADDETMTVSILSVRDDLKEKTKNIIPPLTHTGTAEDLGREWFNRITAPLHVTEQIFDDMQTYVEAQEKLKKEAEAMKQKEQKKEAPTVTLSKFDAQMKKVTELQTQKKYGEAVSALPKAEDFPDKTEAIEAKRTELMQLREQSQNSLFA